MGVYNLDKLIEEYNSLVTGDYHKGRDCHFSIEKRWSYGKFKGYYINHPGYINYIKPEEAGPYADSVAAAGALRGILLEWIEHEKEARDEEGGWKME